MHSSPRCKNLVNVLAVLKRTASAHSTIEVTLTRPSFSQMKSVLRGSLRLTSEDVM